ncbi:MAG: replication protein [Paludibacteraceae bacterium]|nr:replication protein [Paludibacteraceae bacterium]
MASNSPKYRDYFITINKGAECYGVEEIQKRVLECNFKLYAYILHDKDKLITEHLNEETGEAYTEETPKQEHYHLILELKNPVSFNAMQERFKGAHIDIPKYKKSAYQYLIHNTPNSRKEKYQYPLEQVHSNAIAEVKQIIESETYELFHENLFVRYIAEGTRTSYQFAKRFGLNAYRQYWKPYSDMLSLVSIDQELQNDLENMTQAIQEELPF